MEDNKKQKNNNRRKIIIITAIIILIIAITSIAVILIFKPNGIKEKIEQDKLQDKLQEERENIFNQFVEKYKADGLILHDLKFKQNSSEIAAGIYQGNTTEVEYNWDKYGIDEQTYKLLEIHNRESVETMKVLYGAPYSIVEKNVFRVDNLMDSSQKDYPSLEAAVMKSRWEGYKYNWKSEQYIPYIKNRINEQIDSLKRAYKIDFTPTEEQMKELIEQYYKCDFYGEKFNEFLISKGWVAKEDLEQKITDSEPNTEENTDNESIENDLEDEIINDTEYDYNTNNSNSNDSYTYNNQEQEKNIEMPNLVGLSKSQAEQKLKELGIPYNISSITSFSKDKVFYQSVSAGTSKTKSQFGTVTLKAYRKVGQVSAYINISSSNYNGQNIKVIVNGKECKDMYGNKVFNGEYSVMTFANNPNISVEIYIDDALVKSQNINLDEISEKNEISSNEISATINI